MIPSAIAAAVVAVEEVKSKSQVYWPHSNAHTMSSTGNPMSQPPSLQVKSVRAGNAAVQLQNRTNFERTVFQALIFGGCQVSEVYEGYSTGEDWCTAVLLPCSFVR